MRGVEQRRERRDVRRAECFQVDVAIGDRVAEGEATVAPAGQFERRFAVRVAAQAFLRQAAHDAAQEAIGARCDHAHDAAVRGP